MAMESAPYRVLHLINSHQRRGAEVFATQLACCMEQGGLFESGLFSIYGGGDPLPVNGLPLFNLDSRQRPFDSRLNLDIRTVAKLYQTMREFQPDVILAHGSSTLKHATLAGVLYRKATSVYRNIGAASSWSNSRAKIGFNRLLLKGIDAVVSVSQYTRQDFAQVYRYPEERLRFIANGVDVSPFEPVVLRSARFEVRKDLGLPPAAKVLINVGNLSWEKGQREFLTQFANGDGFGPDVHLLLVGDGPLRQALEQQIWQLKIHARVHILGTRSDVPRLLAAADVFILPSKTEGMPAVLIESGLAGLPSVAFDVGGVGEVVEHRVTGLLVPPGRLDMFSRSVSALCQDAFRRSEMGAAARQRCRERFDMRVIAEQYQEFMLGLVGVEPVLSQRSRDCPARTRL